MGIMAMAMVTDIALTAIMAMEGDNITEHKLQMVVVEVLDHEVLQGPQVLPDPKDILVQEVSLVKVVKRDRLVFVVLLVKQELQEKKEVTDVMVKLDPLDHQVQPVRPDLLECQECPV